MFLGRNICMILSVFAVARAAPTDHRHPESRRITVPIWHMPCGENINSSTLTNSDVKSVSWEDQEEQAKALYNILKRQQRVTMADFTRKNYNHTYANIHFSLEKKNYIPNWLPDKKDLDIVKNLVDSSKQTIIVHLPKWHTDLQKFAVAFEELIKDEYEPGKKEAFEDTQTKLKQMLCEIETGIVSMPFLRIPSRVERNIMSLEERNITDDTDRLIRDWGVIFKYQDYLKVWNQVLGIFQNVK